MKRREGFTLMEVLVSVAIAGLTLSAGFRLVAMSMRLLNEAVEERGVTEAGERVLLKFLGDEDAEESGTLDDEGTYQWETAKVSVPVEDFELKLRRVTVSKKNSGYSMYIYVAE